MLKHLDLCSGIGGFALGFEWAGLSRPILFCDIEPWCRDILRKHWPDVPIEKDVKELAHDPTRIPDHDILTAGYPCQPFSLAGKREGKTDDRHLWPSIRQIVALKRPTWVVLENVHGHISLGLDQVLADLEAEGYASRSFIVPACGVDAPHRRDRIWIIASYVGDANSSELEGYDPTANTRRGKQGPSTGRGTVSDPDSDRQQRAGQGAGQDSGHEAGHDTGGIRQDVADPSSCRPQEHGHSQPADAVQRSEAMADAGGAGLEERKGVGSDAQQKLKTAVGSGWWPAEPAVGRVAHGIPRRVDRIKGLGNAIVPQIAEQIGLTIKEYERSKQ